MNKHEKIYCKTILKNNDVSLQLYYNTHEIRLTEIIIFILSRKNNEYIIDPLLTISEYRKYLKKFGFTDLEIDIIEMIRKYEVVDPIDLILKYKDAPDEVPKLSVDEYLKLEDPLQQNLYKLIPKQNALQHKLNFIAHLLKTYKHTVMQAVATKTNSSNTVVANNIDDIIKLLRG
jgi:hypothetical protein